MFGINYARVVRKTEGNMKGSVCVDATVDATADATVDATADATVSASANATTTTHAKRGTQSTDDCFVPTETENDE